MHRYRKDLTPCQRLLAAALLLAPGQCIALNQMAKRQSAEGAAVAACVHGQQRNLLAQPVVNSFRDYVVAPLRREGYRVDVFLVVRDANSAGEVITAAYNPVYLDLAPPRRGQRHALVRVRRGARHGGATRAVIDQWETMITCYEQVVEREKAGGNYSWIYRLRTDTVYFADVPLPSALSPHHVYIPSFGMSKNWDDLCANDHAFVCPRGLCRPYFTVMELFESDKRAGARDREVPVQVPSGLHGPPDQPYRLPDNPGALEEWKGLQDQYWFVKRYGGHRCDPETSELPESCCGTIRPIPWYYSLSRDKGCTKCDIACGYTFSASVRHGDPQCEGGNASKPALCEYLHPPWEKFSAAKHQCEKLGQEWRSSAECQTPNDEHCEDVPIASHRKG